MRTIARRATPTGGQTMVQKIKILLCKNYGLKCHHHHCHQSVVRLVGLPSFPRPTPKSTQRMQNLLTCGYILPFMSLCKPRCRCQVSLTRSRGCRAWPGAVARKSMLCMDRVWARGQHLVTGGRVGVLTAWIAPRGNGSLTVHCTKSGDLGKA